MVLICYISNGQGVYECRKNHSNVYNLNVFNVDEDGSSKGFLQVKLNSTVVRLESKGWLYLLVILRHPPLETFIQFVRRYKVNNNQAQAKDLMW